jgi:hypothetical protein
LRADGVNFWLPIPFFFSFILEGPLYISPDEVGFRRKIGMEVQAPEGSLVPFVKLFGGFCGHATDWLALNGYLRILCILN